MNKIKHEEYDEESEVLIQKGRELYKEQCKLSDEFMSLNGEIRRDDFWNHVFDHDELPKPKCEVCGLHDKLKASYFKSWETGEKKKVMTCTKYFWGKRVK